MKSHPVGLIVSILFTCFLLIGTSFDGSGVARTPNSNPSATPTVIIDLSLGLLQIEEQYNSLSKDNFTNYFSSIKGKRIHWIGKVTGGSGDSLYLNMGQATFRNIYLKGISKDKVAEGTWIEFEADINIFTRFLGLSLFLENPKLIQTYSYEPTKTYTVTLTPTQTLTTTPTIPPTATNTSTSTSTSTPTPSANLTLTNNANVRSGPGQSFKVISVIAHSNILPVYGKNEDGTWLLVDPVNYLWVASSLGTLDQKIESINIAPTPMPTITPTFTPTRTVTATRTLIPTKTPIPSRTPIPAILLLTIYENYQNMTALQFTEYKNQIAGKPVRENVEVGNVSDDGKLIIGGPWSPWIFNWSEFCVVVTGVPKNIALTINGGDVVALESIINGIVGHNNYYFNCENTLLLTYVKITK